MRLIKNTLIAAGCTLAVLDPHKIYNVADFSMYGDASINATAQVDAVIADIDQQIQSSLSQSTTTVTVTFNSPHLLGGNKDYVMVTGTGVAGIDGVYQVATVTNTKVLTYTTSSGSFVGPAQVIPLKFYENLIASASVSATTVANKDTVLSPISAAILNCTTYSAGTVVLDTRVGGMK